jgi:hypothetical protein
MRTQLALEDIYVSYALQTLKKPTVVFCDRGLMDGKAYCSVSIWQGVLDEIEKTEMQLREKRYDAVIHMVTAANGAEQYYTTVNNEA